MTELGKGLRIQKQDRGVPCTDIHIKDFPITPSAWSYVQHPQIMQDMTGGLQGNFEMTFALQALQSYH